jgi:zinc metalloprotease ZmpB
LMMCWDAAPFGGTSASWAGRRYDMAWLFGGPEWNATNGHGRGQLWCATMFEIYRKLGGDSGYPGVRSAARDLIIRLHLQANAAVPSNPTTTQMAQQVEAADGLLGGWRYANGLHKKVIYDAFRRRTLTGYPDKAVDVYVDDGRAGGYGSASGNDLFNENLWDENFWDTQDIWVRTSQYPSAAAQAAGGPSDHVEPPVGSTAYLYVRVANRGTNAGGSGPVTVKAFHCLPGMGLIWPTGWTPMDTPSLTVSNVAPGAGGAVVVGPFDWTPSEVGHECVLVIVECANDRAVTQDLQPTDSVAHHDLVPFDNNIAQRNLVPTEAKGSTARGFFVGNPYPEPHRVRLHFEDLLPRGWRWRTSPEEVEEIELGPFERQWVEVTVAQEEGEEVTSFEKPRTLTVTGTIEGRVIGGMTYYIAPPSTFEPSPTGRDGGPRIVCPEDQLCLNLPWDDLIVEGELDLRVRFRSKE